MPEIINSLFGRTRNDAPEGVASSTTAEVAVTDETVGTNAVEAETAPSADGIAEPTEADSAAHDPADSDSEYSDELDDADDQADDDEPVADEATTGEDLTEEAAAEDAVEDDGNAEDIEPVAAETDTDDVDQTEPVTAETRPAADTRGSVTVGDGVVAKVVNIVVCKVDGVHGLDDEGISVEADDDTATIKVSLVVEYGHAIKALAEQIRVDVIEAVEQFLGLDVAAVDIHVSDIHSPAAV